MDEEKHLTEDTVDIESAETAAPAELEALPAPPPAPLTWRDAAIPLLALAMAVMYWQNVDWVRLADYSFPHLSVLALVAVHFAAVLTVLGKRAHFTPGSIFCMTAAILLGVSCTLYFNEGFVLINCFVILLVAAMATFGLSGHTQPGQGRAVLDGIMLTFLALFSKVGRPFRAAGQMRRSGKGNVGHVLLALLIAVPVVGVVVALLASADQVFGSLLVDIRLPEGDWGLSVYRAVRAVITALFAASALYFILEDTPRESPVKEEKERHALPFLVVTVLLDIVYIIFCAIQIRFLFGGAEAAAMAGGWAQYARSGFFQLVAVAAINLGLCTLGTDEKRFAGKSGAVLRGAFGLLLALTAVILASAFRRMQLYILVYGMSVLRLMTLWAMAVVAVGILAAAWRLCRPGFGFFRVVGGFALGLWCLMNLAGPGRMIADYNVSHYLSGRLEEMDIYYLCSYLDVDALPALRRLAADESVDADVREDAARHIRHLESDWELEEAIPWSRWNLSVAQVRRTVAARDIAFETGTLEDGDGGYLTVIWEGRTYAPYGTTTRRSMGGRLGHLSNDKDDLIYELDDAPPEEYLVEYLQSGLMDTPMVLRALDTKGQPVPDSVTPLEYDDIWEE